MARSRPIPSARSARWGARSQSMPSPSMKSGCFAWQPPRATVVYPAQRVGRGPDGLPSSWTCSGTGARIGEILALHWGDVNLDARPATVTIRGTLIRSDGALVVQARPKTAGSHRVLVLPDFALVMLISGAAALTSGSGPTWSSHPRPEHR